MTCTVFNFGGRVAIVCGKGKMVTPCQVCGKVSVALCDWILEPGKTCDASL